VSLWFNSNFISGRAFYLRYNSRLLKVVVSIIVIFLVIVSGSSCRKRAQDNRRVTPLEVPLKKVGEHFGVAEGENLIPETIPIPAGQFMMGSEKDKDEEIEASETPRHTVTLDGFEMGRLEVTNAQYAVFVNATSYNNDKWKETNKPGKEDYPAINVSSLDALAYCEWLSIVTGKKYRLPTEAEWEYAAGGNQQVRFSWGNGWEPSLANAGKQNQETARVGSYPPNAFGLYDMTGNVWEWCSDLFKDSYYSESPQSNPKGPEDGNSRVMRGGAWNSPEQFGRINFRSHNAPDIRNLTIGFRIVQESGAKKNVS
jgi:formylglycine-generating enzyme required for sulfatase activity